MDTSDMEIDGSSYLKEVERRNFEEWDRANPAPPLPDDTDFSSPLVGGTPPSPPPPVASPMRSSLGKRSFRDFEADNDAFLEPVAPVTALAPPSPPTPEEPRRIVTMLYTIHERTKHIFAYIASFFTAGRQITAVSTSPKGNKRRAIDADDSTTTTQTMAAKEIPGQFPEPSLAMTPPSSRRESWDSKVSQSPQQQEPSREQAQPTKASAKPKKSAPAFIELFPDLAPKSVTETMALYDYLPDHRKRWKKPAPQTSTQSPNAYVPSKLRTADQKQKQKQGKQQDMKIDGLVSRAKQVSKGSPETRRRMDLYTKRISQEEFLKRGEEARELKARAVEEAAEALKEAKKEAKRLAEEARKQAEEAEEEAERKAKADKEAAEEAEKEREKQHTEKQKLIRPLDQKWVDIVAKAMSGKSEYAVVANSPEGVEITRRDLGTLLANPGQSQASSWLNDEIVNAWFSTIVQRKQEQDGYVKNAKNVPAFVAYNTAWYTTYKNRGAEGLSSWSRRKAIKGEKLLRAEKVFFPINTGAHWMLLVISPQTKTIDFLDSLHNIHSDQKKWFGIARKWVAMELGSLYKAEEWTESTARSSLQTNGNDCGAFTCFNGLAAAKGRAYEEVTAGKMQDARRCMGAILLNGGFRDDFEL